MGQGGLPVVSLTQLPAQGLSNSELVEARPRIGSARVRSGKRGLTVSYCRGHGRLAAPCTC